MSVSSFAIIFSHSEGCLFVLLIVSFVVQKLLSFIRSHLFIFAFISITLGDASGSLDLCIRRCIEDPAMIYTRECFTYVLLEEF